MRTWKGVSLGGECQGRIARGGWGKHRRIEEHGTSEDLQAVCYR